MTFLLIALIITLVLSVQATLLFQTTGLIASNESSIKLIQQIKSNKQNYITVVFSIQNEQNLTYTVATASFDKQEIINRTVIEKALNQSSTYSGSADLQAFIEGNTQHIRLQKKQNNSDKLYISIVNFDPVILKRNLTYKIVAQSSQTAFIKNCDNGYYVKTNTNTSTCQCIEGYFGQYCQNRLRELSESQMIDLNLKQYQRMYYVIPKMDQQIALTIKVIGAQVDFYLLKGQTDIPANYFTYSYGNAGKITVPKSNSQGIIQVNTWLSAPLYLTIAKYTSEQTKIQMQFKADIIFSRFLILIFILFLLSGCFSVSFIFLLKIRYYNRVRRARIFRRNIRARNMIFVDEDDLGILPQTKIKHFPTFIIGDVFHPDEHFIRKNIECPICLCEYQLKDQANLLYCGHMFHDQCINGWFQTHKNCPSCRYVFDSANLKKNLLKIQQITGQQQVTGTRHVQALLCILPFPIKKEQQISIN